MACEMPQAMERSVASPTIRAFLPARNPMPSLHDQRGASPLILAADVRRSPDVDREELAGAQGRAAAHVIPSLEVADGDLEAARDRGQRVAALDLVVDLAGCRRDLGGIGGRGRGGAAGAAAAAGDLQALAGLQHGLG